MSFGITAVYQVIPRMRTVITSDIINSNGVSNPVDISPVNLTNVRGQLTISGVANDTGLIWTLQVQGGFGEFVEEVRRNFFFTTGTNINCTVTTLAINRLEVVTPGADAGGRRYILQFQPLSSFGPTIHQTSVNVLGAADITITTTKILLVTG
uniref:Uncharacterized protein n=1 Tax=Marseillevirus LCMAC101 TaxID=2506602 RepID=A0A481YSM4_9VIRU|nr:MAG: uncharacterized protein LCMAC101_03500 [Marseillevirus LCMAC101]